MKVGVMCDVWLGGRLFDSIELRMRSCLIWLNVAYAILYH